VAFWVESTAQEVAGAMMDGVYAPFSARVGQQDAARYYGETLFTPQGTLDPQRWQQEYARLGGQGLAAAINGGAAWRRARGLPVLLPASRFQPTGSQITMQTPAAGTVPASGPPGAPPGVPGMAGPGMMVNPGPPVPITGPGVPGPPGA